MQSSNCQYPGAFDIFDGDWESVYFFAFVHTFHNMVLAVGRDEFFPSEQTFQSILEKEMTNCAKRLNKDLTEFLRERRDSFTNGEYSTRWVIEQPTEI